MDVHRPCNNEEQVHVFVHLTSADFSSNRGPRKCQGRLKCERYMNKVTHWNCAHIPTWQKHKGRKLVLMLMRPTLTRTV